MSEGISNLQEIDRRECHLCKRCCCSTDALSHSPTLSHTTHLVESTAGPDLCAGVEGLQVKRIVIKGGLYLGVSVMVKQQRGSGKNGYDERGSGLAGKNSHDLCRVMISM